MFDQTGKALGFPEEEESEDVMEESGQDVELLDEGFDEPEVLDITIPGNLADVHVSLMFKITIANGSLFYGVYNCIYLRG